MLLDRGIPMITAQYYSGHVTRVTVESRVFLLLPMSPLMPSSRVSAAARLFSMTDTWET